MRRILTATLVGLLLTPTAIFAADDDAAITRCPRPPSPPRPPWRNARTFPPSPDLDPRAVSTPRRPRGLRRSTPARRSFRANAYSTLTVLKHGGVEANPVMRGVTTHPAAFIGLKAGVTAMSIMAAERMWKNNNRLGAVLTMVAMNSMMALVAAHNAHVLATDRRNSREASSNCRGAREAERKPSAASGPDRFDRAVPPRVGEAMKRGR